MALTLSDSRDDILLGQLRRALLQHPSTVEKLPIDSCIASFYAYSAFGWTSIYRLEGWNEIEQKLGPFTLAAIRKDHRTAWNHVYYHVYDRRYTFEDLLEQVSGPDPMEPLSWKAICWACARLDPAGVVKAYIRHDRQELLPMAIWAGTEIVRAELGDERFASRITSCDEAAVILIGTQKRLGGRVLAPIVVPEHTQLSYWHRLEYLTEMLDEYRFLRALIYARSILQVKRRIHATLRHLLAASRDQLSSTCGPVGR